MRSRRVGFLFAAGAGLYWWQIRGWILRWGATDEEARSRLAGDELLDDADGVATRAISIHAPASAVWPWVVQMGPLPRGGAYTYDWIENLLGLNMHSADRVLPEFQHPKVGDTIGYGTNRMRTELVDPLHAFAWRSEDGNWVWSFVLHERDGVTRLISRNRFRLPTAMARLGMFLMEPASLVMERKMLIGIKHRAEGLAAEGIGSLVGDTSRRGQPGLSSVIRRRRRERTPQADRPRGARRRLLRSFDRAGSDGTGTAQCRLGGTAPRASGVGPGKGVTRANRADFPPKRRPSAG